MASVDTSPRARSSRDVADDARGGGGVRRGAFRFSSRSATAPRRRRRRRGRWASARGATTPTNPRGRARARVRRARAPTKTDILKKCGRLVDPRALGSLSSPRSRRLGVVLSMERLRETERRARESERECARANESTRRLDAFERTGESGVGGYFATRATGRRSRTSRAKSSAKIDERRERAPRRATKSVLIVDDVACVRKFHAGQIGRLGYQSIEAGGEHRAATVGKITRGSRHLIGFDDAVMDGYSTANEIQALEEKRFTTDAHHRRDLAHRSRDEGE